MSKAPWVETRDYVQWREMLRRLLEMEMAFTGFSAADVAREAGGAISPRSVDRFVSGKTRFPQARVLMHIAKVLGLSSLPFEEPRERRGVRRQKVHKEAR